ncbi:MAG: prepilin-type N-terminal cleavage/methylation domain-containing protein [Oscillospiraceae bacterium]|nr:prepilin-type N-terminal cleavage/methylation domain-containing protein [Oscillospiraceae bacterium]
MKKKKKLKGMTLMEVIIAMVVMVICASMLVEAAICVVNNTRTARTVIVKVDEQAPGVENRTVGTPYETGAVLQLQYNGVHTIPVDKYEAPTTQVSDIQKSGNMKYFMPVTTVPTT